MQQIKEMQRKETKRKAHLCITICRFKTNNAACDRENAKCMTLNASSCWKNGYVQRTSIRIESIKR